MDSPVKHSFRNELHIRLHIGFSISKCAAVRLEAIAQPSSPKSIYETAAGKTKAPRCAFFKGALNHFGEVFLNSFL